jgi:hypothetical protein
MKPIRRHLSYANIVATLALLFAMGGSAVAAKHYLINSTKQINPKVLKALRGARGPRGFGSQGLQGPRGVTGLTGVTGSLGPKGAEGVPGQSALTPLQSGQTESGDFGASSPNSTTTGVFDETVTFPIPLAAEVPESKVIFATGPTEHCPGPSRADAGFLCVYTKISFGVAEPPRMEEYEEEISNGSGRFGFDLEWDITKAGAFAFGTYTVTAP